MIVTRIQHSGNSAKFHVVTKSGEFKIALSYTLRAKIWELADPDDELAAAQQLSEAIVSRHDPKLPFPKVYVLGEHNVPATLNQAIQQFRKFGFNSKPDLDVA